MSEPMHTGKPVECRSCGAKGQVTVTTWPASADTPERIALSYLSQGFTGAIEDGRAKITCSCGAQVWR